MRKRRKMFSCFSVFVMALAGWGLLSAGEISSCVSCHKKVESVSYLEHNYADWEKSIHARADVSCHVCHGGNPGEATKEKAHAGVFPSTHKESRVYFTRVSDTCGTCHGPEVQAFKKSAHYKELMRSGRGPNCVTCHGSMANHVLQPRELEMTCTLCHRQPTQAYAAMLSLNNAGSSLKKLTHAIEEAKREKISYAAQEKKLENSKQTYDEALYEWHTFNMTDVIKTSQKILKQVNTALNELQLKKGK